MIWVLAVASIRKTTYNLVSNDISNTGIGKLETVSKLEVVKAIDATTKFSELGALVINLDRKQIKNAIDGISSNLQYSMLKN